MKKKLIFSFKNAENVKYKVYLKEKVSFYKNKKLHLAYGICSSPEYKNPRIELEAGLKNKRELSTILEEFLHAFYFDKTEKEIKLVAKTISKFLYKNNWRKINKK